MLNTVWVMGVTSVLSPITRQGYDISPRKKIVISQHFYFSLQLMLEQALAHVLSERN